MLFWNNSVNSSLNSINGDYLLKNKYKDYENRLNFLTLSNNHAEAYKNAFS